MKTTLVAFTLFIFSFPSLGQSSSPVTWSFESRKKSDKAYEVVLSANVPKPWHIYSQFTPEGGPLPTTITFGSNPIYVVDGAAKEAGDLTSHHDETFDVDVKYFSNKVQFIQAIKLKASVKTSVRGNIEYMVCNDNKCLPPVKQPFEIKLQ